MLGCIVYVSKAADGWTDAAVTSLLAKARRHNEAAGITGRLLFVDGRFVQLLEGPADAIARLYGAILADRRHGNIVTLLDTTVAARAYPEWSMDYVPQGDMSAAARESVAAFLRRSDLDPAADLANALRIIGGAHGVLRVSPSRAGAWTTVGRLLDAATGLLRRDGIAAVDVDTVARAANVTRQAAYRYFASGEQLLRALVRRQNARMFLLCRAYLRESRVAGDAEAAQLVARIVLKKYMTGGTVPRAIALRLLRDYHEVAYDAWWLLAAELRDAMQRSGVAGDALPDRTDLAVALAATSSGAKMIALNDPDALRTERTQAALAGMFLGALRGAARGG